MNNKEIKFIEKYGKWALITGATDGIGKDFVEELAKRGFSLYLVARRKEVLNQIKQDITNKYKVQVMTLDIDLSKKDNLKKLISETEKIDIGLIVLAAGFGSGGEFSDLDIETELQMIDLNCNSVVYITHNFLNRFKLKGKGGIILFGSLVGFQGVSWTSVYAATKAFIQSFVEGIRGEIKNKGIDILSIAPGPIQSGFGTRANMKMDLSQSPNGIAKKSLDSLGKQTTIRPGFLSKLLGYSLITLPRTFRTMILNSIMKKMIFSKK